MIIFYVRDENGSINGGGSEYYASKESLILETSTASKEK
jgi:hypothetical protein